MGAYTAGCSFLFYIALSTWALFLWQIAHWLIGRKRCTNSLHVPIILATPGLLLMLIALKQGTAAIVWSLIFSALIISIHTDLCAFLLSRLVTLFAIPAVWIAIAAGWLDLSLFESIVGALSAYLFLFAIEKGYERWTGHSGMGDGDKELLAYIGAFLGFGWWYALLIGSWLGTLCAVAYKLYSGQAIRFVRIPFGPFLALGAIAYVLVSPLFHYYLPILLTI
ncbi:MAG: prepilin peptidase [Candidatus Babeliales bacterium]